MKILNNNVCIFCEKQFLGRKAAEHLKRHITCVHDKLPRPKTKVEKVLCSLCGKKYNKYLLKAHVDRMHGEENLPCKYCDKTLKSSFSLKQHMHHCKVEVCFQCGVIVSQNRMKKHIILCHSPYEMRPFKCQYCDIRYVDKPALTRHVLKVHFHQTPYKCSQCTKTFLQKCSLAHHVKHTHSTKRLYYCEICNKSFTRPEKLTVHRRKIHHLLSKVSISKRNKFCFQYLELSK